MSATAYIRRSNEWKLINFSGDPLTTEPVSHGRAITPSNTGHTAYFDNSLSRRVRDTDLITHPATVLASDFTTAGGTISKRNFQNGVIIDIDNVTFVACKVNGGFSGLYLGVHHPFALQWCTMETTNNAGSNGIEYQDYTANRCRIMGSSDGAKINGNAVITESYIRCKGQASNDHNDGVQNAGGVGPVSVLRCNIDCRPLNGLGDPNAALFAADNCQGLMTWKDNLIAGGGYVIRCSENATYNVQGNDLINGSWVFGPVVRGPIPASNLTWGDERPNYIVSNVGTRLSIVNKP